MQIAAHRCHLPAAARAADSGRRGSLPQCPDVVDPMWWKCPDVVTVSDRPTLHATLRKLRGTKPGLASRNRSGEALAAAALV